MEYKMKKPAKKMMYGGKMPYADKMAGGGKTGMRGQVKKDEKTGQKKRIKKGTEEYGRSRMEGLKSVSPDDIKTVYPTRGSISTTKREQFAYGPGHPKAKSALAPKTSVSS
jgi:hypothetical protein